MSKAAEICENIGKRLDRSSGSIINRLGFDNTWFLPENVPGDHFVKITENDESFNDNRICRYIHGFDNRNVGASFLEIRTMPTDNKHIFVRSKKMCLFLEMCLF